VVDFDVEQYVPWIAQQWEKIYENILKVVKNIVKMLNDEQLVRENEPRLDKPYDYPNGRTIQIDLQNQETNKDKQYRKCCINILSKKEEEEQRERQNAERKKMHNYNIEQHLKYLQRLYYDNLLHREYNDDEIEKIQREAIEINYYNQL